jgi:hypothetical protein
MTVIFTRKPGVQLWDSGETIASPTELATVSIVVGACDASAPVLESLLQGLWGHERAVWRWYTYGRPLPDGSAIRRKLLRELESDSEGFNSTRVSIDSGSAPSLIAQLQRPLRSNQFGALALRRQNLLAIVPADLGAADLLQGIGQASDLINESRINTLLHAHPDWLLAMYFDDGCNHCVLQLFGSPGLADALRTRLAHNGAKETDTRDAAVTDAWMQ